MRETLSKASLHAAVILNSYLHYVPSDRFACSIIHSPFSFPQPQSDEQGVVVGVAEEQVAARGAGHVLADIARGVLRDTVTLEVVF